VFHEADSFGSKYGNGSWSGIVGLVSSGIADIGVSGFIVSKARSEVVAHTDALQFLRWDRPLYLLSSQWFWICFFQRDAFLFSKISFLFFKYPSCHEIKIDAGKEFNIFFCLSLITNSNLKLKTIYMIPNCNTHNDIFTLSYVSVLNISSIHYAIIFKRRHYEGVLIIP